MQHLAYIIDPDEVDARLHYAAIHGQKCDLELLLQEPNLQKLLNFNIRPIGSTPLGLAATGGHVDCIQLLLEHGALVDKTDWKGQTPLFITIKNKYFDCSKLLLQNGADPNGNESNRCTPLYLASQEGWVEGLKLLLDYNADPEIYGRLCGPSAPQPNDFAFIQQIRENFQSRFQAVSHISGYFVGSPLQTAVSYKRLDCFATLLLNGAEVDLRYLQPSLPSHVIEKLSITHAMVKYDALEVFARIFAEFGGNLWQRDSEGRLATDLPSYSVCRETLAALMDCPLRLQSVCRIKIRRLLGRRKLEMVRQLPVPVKIMDFLMYRDMIPQDLLGNDKLTY